MASLSIGCQRKYSAKKLIKELGVEIRLNTKLNSLNELSQEGYDAISLALGAHHGVKIGIKGEDLPGVVECISSLRDVNLGKEVKLGNKVAVIGGGNAAIDASRTALRLGAKEITILYCLTRAEMPASPEEVEEALYEGVKIQFLVAPKKITRENGRLKMECIQMGLGSVDASGRRRPEPIAGSEFSLEFNMLIAATGEMPDIPSQLGVHISKGNRIQVGPDTLATDREGVFAGGDVVSGPASIIEAIAAGRQAAISIDKYLGGNGVIDETLVPPEEIEALPEIEEGERPRVQTPCLPLSERLRSFAPVELGFTEEMAIEEAKRCLRCDLEERE